MTNVTERCVPLSTGALGPDLRVNYQFGLVLGVDEFEQEDRYFRERDERHARSLHGYGTDSGLQVTTARPAAAPSDVEVRVSEGIGVDQYGRPIVLRAAQCALVGAWIAEEERRAMSLSPVEPPLAAHLSPSGDVTIYVVASYSSCFDALVPLPGNPCGSDDDVTAPSRIRDSWSLEFRWEPPAMPAWDGIRALADLLLQIEMDDGSPFGSDEAVLIEHVRGLAAGAAPPSSILPQPPRLPRHEARAALDRLLTEWVTKVRPTLAPDLLDPEGEAGILLAAVTVTPAAAFDTANPVIDAFGDPDDEGRPYLAPTQVLQELLLLGGGTTIFAGSPVAPPASRTQIQLATLGEAVQNGERHLVLWTHLADPVVLPGALPVRRNGAAPVDFIVSASADGLSWILTPPAGAPLQDLEFVEVELPVDRIEVQDAARAAQVRLLRYLDDAGLDLVDRVDDVVRVHHQVEQTVQSAPAPDPVRPKDVRELATVTMSVTSDELQAELWFHVDKDPRVDEERVARIPSDAVLVLAEMPDDPNDRDAPVQLAQLPFRFRRSRHNVWAGAINLSVWKERADMSRWLRVVFNTRELGALGFGASLAEYYEALNATAPSSFEDGAIVVVYARVPGVRE